MFSKAVFPVLCCSLIMPKIGLAVEPAPESVKKENKIRTIMSLKQMFSDDDDAIPAEFTPQPAYKKIIEKGDVTVLIYRSRFVESKELVNSVESVISAVGMVEEVPDKNLLVVTDTAERIEHISAMIDAMDIMVPQVLVEAKVVEVFTNNQFNRELEMAFNKGTLLDTSLPQEGIEGFPFAGNQPTVIDFSPFSAGISGQVDRFRFFLNWLSTSSDAKILSSPNLTVSLGNTGSIVTGEDLPIQSTSTTGSTVNTDIKYKRTGITLNVTPVRINNDLVTLNVNPEVSTVVRYEQFGGDTQIRVPVVSVRNVKTELNVQDGEIIMLGGLYSSEELNTEKKVPFLGDLPFVGPLFTSIETRDQMKQLVFMLKVRILSRGIDSVVDVGQSARELNKVSDYMDQVNAEISAEMEAGESQRELTEEAPEAVTAEPSGADAAAPETNR